MFEPAHFTKGFDILYLEVDHDKNGNFGKLYRQRDFKRVEEMEEADLIFAEFQSKLSKVFRANNLEDLQAHIELFHGNNPASFTAHFFTSFELKLRKL